MRLRARRDTVEAEIVAALRQAGCSVTKLSAPDIPDLLVGLRGRTLMAEVKTGREKLRPGQRTWAATWRGEPPVVLRSVDDALALIGRTQ